MPLNVGELVTLVTVDDDKLKSGLDDAEQHVRDAGREMEQAAERAGQEAGEEAGEAFAEGVEEGADGAGQQLTANMEGARAGVAGAAAAVGAAAAAALVGAMTEAFEQSRIVGRLEAQLGATPAEAKKYGEIAGDMYAEAITQDFQQAADAISATMRSGLLPADATNAQIKSIATKVTDLANTFEFDLGQTANAVGQMIKTGLAKNATEALDAITRGMQEMGPRADDLMDTFNEYSTQFRQLGLTAEDALGIMSQGLKAGARDTDVVADSLKEFVLIAQAGGEDVDAAFSAIGLSGAEMQRVFSKGGPKAREALDKVFDGLRRIKDPAERAEIALALFGTKAEDMQKALTAIDPSDAIKDLGKVGGAAKRMGDALRDNAGARVEAFKRGIQQNVVEFVGGTVIPAMQEFTSFVREEFSEIWQEAGKGAESMPDRILNFMQILGEKLINKLVELAPKAIEGLKEFGKRVAAYIANNPMEILKVAAIAGAIIVAIAALPALVMGALIAAAVSIITGFVDQMISETGEQLEKWWGIFKSFWKAKKNQAGDVLSGLGDAISEWFGGLWRDYVERPVSRTWNSFIGTVKALPGRAVSGLASLGADLAGEAIRGVGRFKNAAVRKFNDTVQWVRGVPGRIVRGMGYLGSLLWDKGVDIALGLLNGIKSMGGWIASQLRSWAASIIPGPIADALGIASPSRVMAREVGRWIPAGIVAGIDQGRGQLESAMRSLVQPPPVPQLRLAGPPGMAGAYGSAFGEAAAGRDGAPLLHIDNWNAAENGTPADNARALAWEAKARG